MDKHVYIKVTLPPKEKSLHFQLSNLIANFFSPSEMVCSLVYLANRLPNMSRPITPSASYQFHYTQHSCIIHIYSCETTLPNLIFNPDKLFKYLNKSIAFLINLSSSCKNGIVLLAKCKCDISTPILPNH